MEINIETGRYNQRALGRPWIAKVDFAGGLDGGYDHGIWRGEHRKGSEGILIIEANPGEIIVIGQKYYYAPLSSSAVFYVLDDKGEIIRLGNRSQAFLYYQENKKN